MFSILDTKYLRINKSKVTLPKNEDRSGFGNIIILNNNSPQGSIDFIKNPFYNKMNLYKRVYIDIKYSMRIRGKQIYKNITSSRLEILKKYADAADLTPVINLKTNKDHNLYYDMFKYNEFFFANTLKTNYKIKYEEYIKMLKEILAQPVYSQFKNRMMFIYVPDISVNKLESTDNIFDNPINILFIAMKKDITLFKSIGDIDIVFADKNSSIKINPSKCDEKSYSMFKSTMNRLPSIKGIIDDTENDGVIDDVVDIEEDTPIELNNEEESVDTDNTDNDNEDVSGSVDVGDIMGEEDADGEVTDEESLNKKIKTEDEQINDEFDTLELLKSLDDHGLEVEDKPRGFVLTPRDKEIKEKQKTIEVSGFKIGDIHKKSGLETKIPHNDISAFVKTGNEDASKITFDNFEEVYNKEFYHKDIVSIVDDFKDKSLPVFIRDAKIENTSDTMNLKHTFTFNLEDVNRTRHTLKIDVPIFVDNEFMVLNGNKKSFVKQRFLKPLVKTGPDTVQACTNYNKIFMTRQGEIVESKFEKFKQYVIEHKKSFSYKLGDCTRSNVKYNTSIEYDTLARTFSEIICKSDKGVICTLSFNQDMLKKYCTGNTKYTKSYEDAISSGRMVIGFNDKDIITVDLNSNIVTEGTMVIKEDSIVDFVFGLLGDKIDLNQFASYKAGSRFMYTRCMIMKKKIPLVILLAYCEGLTTVLKKAKIKHVFTDKRPRLEGMDNVNKGIIQFADGYLVYDKYPLSNSLLLNGLTVAPIKSYNYADFDSKDIYLDIFEILFGSRILANALDNFYDFMIDPVSKLILKDMNYPTEFVGLMLLGNTMLSDNNFADETVMYNYRVRSNELVYAYAYKELTDAFIRYKLTADNKNPVKISIPQDKILKNIMMSEIVEDTSKLSPILELEKSRSMTDKGPSGTNLDQAYTMKRRSFDESMLGIVAMSTSPDANVGVVRELTAEPNVTNVRGYFKTGDNKQNDINLFSAAELITPLGVNKDDAIRTAMASKQSKHIIPVADASPVLISNAMEKTLPYRTGTDFSIVAKEDGTVVEIDEHNEMIIVKYKGLPKEDEIQIINIGKSMDKNGAGGFYISNKFTHDLKKGDKFKKNEILAYNDKFYSRSHNEGVRFNIGTLVPVACASTYASFEDDCYITKEFSEKAATEVVMPKSIVLGANANVEYIVKVGQEVHVNDPLILFDQSTEDASFNKLLVNIGDDLKEEIQGLGKTPVKSHYAGVIEDIKIYSTVELNEMSPSLKKLVSDYYKKITNKKKLIAKFRDKSIPTTDYLFNESDSKIETKDGKVKGNIVNEGVLIEIYIKYKDPVGIGDKIVNFAALKGIVGEVIPEGLEPFTVSDPSNKIATSFGSAAVLARMVPSVLTTMANNEVLYQLKERLRELYAKENPSFAKKK